MATKIVGQEPGRRYFDVPLKGARLALSAPSSPRLRAVPPFNTTSWFPPTFEFENQNHNKYSHQLSAEARTLAVQKWQHTNSSDYTLQPGNPIHSCIKANFRSFTSSLQNSVWTSRTRLFSITNLENIPIYHFCISYQSWNLLKGLQEENLCSWGQYRTFRDIETSLRQSLTPI